MALEIVVRESQVAQFGARNGTIILVRLPLHPLEHRVADGVDGECLAVRRKRDDPKDKTDYFSHFSCKDTNNLCIKL